MAAGAFLAEQGGQNIRRDACAIVCYAQHKVAAFLPPGDGDRAVFSGGLNAVEDRIFYKRLQGQLDDPVAVQFLRHRIPKDRGVDECSTWGDYFYLELLARLTTRWDPYW